MSPTHILESQQFDRKMLEELFDSADSIRDKVKKEDKSLLKSLQGKVMCTLFYEPSTRTRMSFESSMLRLGGTVTAMAAAGTFSSAAKGESLEDSIRVLSNYSNVIVIRSNDDNAAYNAAQVSNIPIINAGCGTMGQHPTQALLDLYTINKERGKIDGVNIAIAGDLKNGRTVRSLAYLLGKFNGVNIHFVSPKGQMLGGGDITDYLQKHKVTFQEHDNWDKTLSEVDVVYMTRIQKERISPYEYTQALGQIKISPYELGKMKSDSILLHPLPHVEEINLPIETETNDKRVAYFRQAENGLYIRMALLKKIL